jgi:dipeptidyl aminopeptidase/acylaminoacyl peptidase
MYCLVLASLPYVDADNLGVCGCSGGGTQSSYLASVDKRIKAASIACYMSTIETDYDYDYGGEYDGEQTWYGYLYHCTRYDNPHRLFRAESERFVSAATSTYMSFSPVR